MKELLNKIGITEAGYFSENGNYIIDFSDSDAFSNANAKLDNSNLVEENVDSSVVTDMVSNIMYISDDFSLNLIANFDTDEYKLVVSNLY